MYNPVLAVAKEEWAVNCKTIHGKVSMTLVQNRTSKLVKVSIKTSPPCLVSINSSPEKFHG